MSSLSEVTICLSGDLGLLLRDRLNNDSRTAHEGVELLDPRIFGLSFNDDGRFYKCRRRNATIFRLYDSFGEYACISLVKKDGDHCRCVDDHRGSPRSS